MNSIEKQEELKRKCEGLLEQNAALDKVCREVIEGESISRACLKHGIDYLSVLEFINCDGLLRNKEEQVNKPPSSNLEVYDWKQEFVNDLFGRSDTYVLPDFEEAFEKCLQTLTEREQRCIKERYVEDKTLEEIGKDLELSRERVRQILAKGLRKFRHPTRARYLQYGLEESSGRELCDLEIEKESLTYRIRNTKKGIERLAEELYTYEKKARELVIQKDVYLVAINEIKNTLDKIVSGGGVDFASVVPRECLTRIKEDVRKAWVREIGLKESTVTSLEAANIKTVRLLLEFSPQELEGIYCVDSNAIADIKDTLKKFDLHLATEFEEVSLDAAGQDIAELGLSIRAQNSLKRAGIFTTEELLTRNPYELKYIRNLGKKTYNEILTKLNSLNLHFTGKHEE